MPAKADAASHKDPASTTLNYHQRNFHLHSYASLIGRQAAEMVKNILHSLKPKTVFMVAMAVVLLVFFGRHLKDILLVSALAFAASYSTIYKRTIRMPSAVELVTFGTVITGAAYGPGIGAAFGVLTTFASEIISSGVDVNTLFYAVSRGIAGGLAQLLIVHFGLSVLMVGMIALVIFHVVSDAIYVVSGGIEVMPKVLYFIVVNTFFNLLVFSFLGKLVLKFAMF